MEKIQKMCYFVSYYIKQMQLTVLDRVRFAQEFSMVNL
jgi:hypothetical protein